MSFYRLSIVACLAAALCACSSGERLEYAEEIQGDKRMRGTVKNGVKHGEWITVEPDVSTRIEHWHEGMLHGPFREWDHDVDMYTDGTYHAGVLHGRFRIFYDLEQIARLEWYDRGRRVHTWCHWAPEGSLDYIRVYMFDKLVREDLEPPGQCPVVLGPGARHLDPSDLDFR